MYNEVYIGIYTYSKSNVSGIYSIVKLNQVNMFWVCDGLCKNGKMRTGPNTCGHFDREICKHSNFGVTYFYDRCMFMK